MRLTKRELKRIIREEYSRLKRRGLIREMGEFPKGLSGSERGKYRTQLGFEMEKQAAERERGRERNRMGHELYKQAQEVKAGADGLADLIMAELPEGCSYDEVVDFALDLGYDEDDVDEALDIIGHLEKGS